MDVEIYLAFPPTHWGSKSALWLALSLSLLDQIEEMFVKCLTAFSLVFWLCIDSPNAYNNQDKVGLKLEKNSVWILHGCGSDPQHWSVNYHLPRRVPRRSWNCQQRLIPNPVILISCKYSRILLILTPNAFSSSQVWKKLNIWFVSLGLYLNNNFPV